MAIDHDELTLADVCCWMYHNAREGKTAIEAYVSRHHPEVRWHFCEGCDDREPIDKDGDCLICGSPVEREG